MTIALGLSSLTATTASLTLVGYGASGSIEVQFATRPDFSFCIAPIYTVTRGSPRVIKGLNQRCTYYARARTRLGDGTAEAWSNVLTLRTADGTAQTYPTGILMDPALIVIPTALKSYTGADGNAGYPTDNLFVDAPVAMRQTGVDNTTYFANAIFFTPGSNVPINTIALLNTNLPEDATWVISYSEDPSWSSGSTAVSSGSFRASANLPGRNGYHGLSRFTTTRATYWRIDINSGVSLMHAEYLIAGMSRVSKNIGIDKTETANPLTTIERKRSGIPDRQSGLAMRKVDIDLVALTETQYETLYGDLIYRSNEPVLIVPNARSNAFLHDRILFGDLSGGRATMNNTPIYSRSFTVDSLI